jgi:hypothetical protein
VVEKTIQVLTDLQDNNYALPDQLALVQILISCVCEHMQRGLPAPLVSGNSISSLRTLIEKLMYYAMALKHCAAWCAANAVAKEASSRLYCMTQRCSGLLDLSQCLELLQEMGPGNGSFMDLFESLPTKEFTNLDSKDWEVLLRRLSIFLYAFVDVPAYFRSPETGIH